jgi:hypothetical protein
LSQADEHEDVPSHNAAGIGREALVEGQRTLLCCLPDTVEQARILTLLSYIRQLPSS